ncbi:MAG: type II toxin-antitoxin system RelE family toxin [Puniceicoccales bacterium]
MGSYSVQFKRSAEKDLRKIDRTFLPAIVSKVQLLATDPRPPGARKLQGSERSYRIRIGDYRVVYAVEDEIRVISIERIAHRKDVYR